MLKKFGDGRSASYKEEEEEDRRQMKVLIGWT